MNIPTGHRAVCLTCGGSGSRIRARGSIRSGSLRIRTEAVEEDCRSCEGTGWIPPKHPPENDGPDPEALG